MDAFEERWRPQGGHRPRPRWRRFEIGLTGVVLLVSGLVATVYNMCKIEVGTGQQAVLDPPGGARARARHGAGAAAERRHDTTTRASRRADPTMAF